MVEKAHTAGWLPDFYEPLRNIGMKVADWFAPKSEASASPESYRIVLELPGVAAENFGVTEQDNALTIKGEKKSQHEDSGETYFFSEREYGAFQRTFRLPPDADQAGISADFENGVLTVTVPKIKQSTAKETGIKINVK